MMDFLTGAAPCLALLTDMKALGSASPFGTRLPVHQRVGRVVFTNVKKVAVGDAHRTEIVDADSHLRGAFG
jgi:hypothetical protein